MTDTNITAEPLVITVGVTSTGNLITPEPSKQPVSKVPKYHTSGLLIDQQLKINRSDDQQLSFDSLQEQTKKAIQEGSREVTEVIEGIKLTASQKKVVDSICKLFHKKSQTYKPDKNDYYTGNAGYDVIVYGGEQTIAPTISLTPYELTLEYKGGDRVTGKDLKTVNKILRELAEKRYLMKYIETTKTKDGTKIERGIEEYLPLIRLPKYYEKVSKNNIELSKKEETLVVLNPIFRRQIADKYYPYPEDILKRTKEANGSPWIHPATFNLRDYLMRAILHKRYKDEMYEITLHDLLAPDLVKQGRRKQILEDTRKAIEVSQKLGLLLKYETVPSYKGKKYIFHLNKDWE